MDPAKAAQTPVPNDVQLSCARLSSARKAPVITLTVVAVVLLLPITAVAAVALSNFSGAMATIGPVVLTALGCALIVAVIWGLVRAMRSGAVLHGSLLITRTALTSAEADLATAELLQVTWPGPGNRLKVPALNIVRDAHGRSATMYFSNVTGNARAAWEVGALAQAIRSGNRAGQAAAHAEQAIGQLYWMLR